MYFFSSCFVTKDKNREPSLHEIKVGNPLKSWKVRERLFDSEHPRYATYLLEYKNMTTSFIAQLVDTIPCLELPEEEVGGPSEPIDLEEEWEEGSEEGEE